MKVVWAFIKQKNRNLLLLLSILFLVFWREFEKSLPSFSWKLSVGQLREREAEWSSARKSPPFSSSYILCWPFFPLFFCVCALHYLPKFYSLSCATGKFHFTGRCFEHPSIEFDTSKHTCPWSVAIDARATGSWNWGIFLGLRRRRRATQPGRCNTSSSSPLHLQLYTCIHILSLFLFKRCMCNLFTGPGKTYTQTDNNLEILKSCWS